MSSLQFIDQQRVHYPVRQLCQVLRIVPSHYYGWRHAQASRAAGTSEPAWETEMVAVFDHHKRRYGTRRLQVELRELGPQVGRQALRTALHRHRCKALPPKVLCPAHHRFDPWAALRSELASGPAQAHSSQPGMGERDYLPAAGQRGLGPLVCLSGRVHQACRGLAGAGRYARGPYHQRLAAGAAGPTARSRPHRSFRPCRAVSGQRLQGSAARRPSPALE